MNKCKNTKTLRDRTIEGLYVPDSLEEISTECYKLNQENEQYKSYNDNFFKTLNKVTHNHQAIKNSTNYKIMAEYISALTRTKNSKKTNPKERFDIVQELLENGACNHFKELTEKLYSIPEYKKYDLLSRLVEFPLECMGSYIQCITNSDAYLRRKYYDGQVRTKSDGSTYQRKCNINTESDLINIGEDGNEISPMLMVGKCDNYFDNINELLLLLDDNEKEVAKWLFKLSTYSKSATINDIVEHTHFTKRQVENIQKKIKYKMLKWLYDNNLKDDYKDYYNKCKKYKDFGKNYNNFLKKCEKTASLCTI